VLINQHLPNESPASLSIALLSLNGVLRVEHIFAGKQLKFWLAASRMRSLGQSLAAYVLGAVAALGAMAHAEVGAQALFVGLGLAVSGFFGVAAAHCGLNLFDDYFDANGGAVSRREELLEGGFRARLGKCAYLKDGSVSLRDTRRVAGLFIVFALALGVVIWAVRGWEVLLFAGVALLLGLAYAGPPLRLSYRGLGELVVGLIFGPLLVSAAFFVTAGHLAPGIWWAATAIGLLVANILNTHAIMDFEPDQAAGRMTFALLLGSKRAAFWANMVMVGLSYVCVVAGVLLRALPLAALCAFVTLPLFVTFVRQLYAYVDECEQSRSRHEPNPIGRRELTNNCELSGRPVQDAVTSPEFKPRWWMGPMGNWQLLRQRQLDWFMLRWLLARNLVMETALLLALGSLTPWYLP
jgi:1,4-dihydroxy-2-naphthoate octaprenyltransferase